MFFDIVFTLFLVFLNGFFVAAEFAIVKVRSSQIEVRKGVSNTVVSVAKGVVANLDGYLAATQLGITLASLGLGWVGQGVFTVLVQNALALFSLNLSADLLQKISILLAFLSITIMHIVFGELAPKSLAIRKPASVTFAVALPLRLFYIFFKPFIWFLNGLANMLLRLVGLQSMHEHDNIHSEEELKVIIAESHKGGVLEEIEKALIQNVFNLGDRSILSLMTPRKDIVWLDIEASTDQNKQKVLDSKYTVYPVCRGELDEVIGFVYAKHLLGTNFDENLRQLELLCSKALIAITTNKAYAVLDQFKQSKIYQALVVDEYGSVNGFVTINDIVDALVGNISETDEFEYQVEIDEQGRLIVDAQIPFVEFIEKIKPNFADESFTDFTTLAGYIIKQLARLPQLGDKVDWHDMEFKVVKMDHNRIDKVMVEQIEGR